MITIQLFNVPKILCSNVPQRVSRRKSRALLYYLAANNGPVPRSEVLDMFWSDLDRTGAQQSLRTTVYNLRKQLGDDIIQGDDFLELGPGTQVDARSFDTRLKAESGEDSGDPEPLEEILGLCTGEFLQGFHLKDAPEFEDWQQIQVEYYRRRYVQGLVELSRRYEMNRAYRRALGAIDRALLTDPLQEDLQRTALKLHFLAGDRAGAIRRYEHLRNILDEEMGVPPMPETRQMYDAIIADDPRLPDFSLTPPATTSRRFQKQKKKKHQSQTEYDLPFTGRSEEIAQLKRAAAPGKLVLIQGEPGIGKTRLVQEFLSGEDSFALSGAANELEQSLPYFPVIEALRGIIHHPDWGYLQNSLSIYPVWLAEAARLLPELLPEGNIPRPQGPGLAGLPGPATESRLWEGVSRLVRAVSERNPLIIFIDDLQWADDSTLALLAYLVRSSDHANVRYIAATRTAPARNSVLSLTQVLQREGRLAVVKLGVLQKTDVITLANRILQVGVDDVSEWLLTNSEGSPFILAELFRYLRASGVFESSPPRDSKDFSTFPFVPQNVYTLIQSRLLKLSAEARKLLDVGVVVGRTFSFDLVQQASGFNESAALDALDELLFSGLIVQEKDGSYRFDHILTMEVAWREVTKVRQMLLHRSVAETLERTHAGRIEDVSGLLAFHYLEGGRPEKAAPFALMAAGNAVAVSGWKEAVGLYEVARKGLVEEEQFEVLLKLGEAHEQAGQASRAADTYRAALRSVMNDVDRSRADRARLALARSLLTKGSYEEAWELADEVLQFGDQDCIAEAAYVMGTGLSIGPGSLAEAMQILRRGLSNALERQNDEMAAAITFEIGSISAQQGDLEAAILAYKESLEYAENTGPNSSMWRALAYNNLAYHSLLLERIADARKYAAQGIVFSEKNGLLSLMPFLLSTNGEILLHSGDLDGSENSFSKGLELAKQLSIPERIAGLTANLGLIALEKGDVRTAILRLSTAMARADALGTNHLAAQIRIWLAPHIPDPERQKLLSEARELAEAGGRAGLLRQIEAIQAS